MLRNICATGCKRNARPFVPHDVLPITLHALQTLDTSEPIKQWNASRAEQRPWHAIAPLKLIDAQRCSRRRPSPRFHADRLEIVRARSSSRRQGARYAAGGANADASRL
ncbi:hypothetical protein [Paraburkholderia jirisanensis]